MACMCWRKNSLKKKKKKKRSTEEMSMSHGMMRRRTTASLEDELIQQQALAMALHQQHKAQLRFERSLSHRDLGASTRRSYSSLGKPGTSSGRLDEYTRSASTRPRHSNDVLLDPQQLNLNNGIKVTNSSLLTSRASSLLWKTFSLFILPHMRSVPTTMMMVSLSSSSYQFLFLLLLLIISLPMNSQVLFIISLPRNSLVLIIILPILFPHHLLANSFPHHLLANSEDFIIIIIIMPILSRIIFLPVNPQWKFVMQ